VKAANPPKTALRAVLLTGEAITCMFKKKIINNLIYLLFNKKKKNFFFFF
jgi:hypothetical protein